jgi:hypothetical protein
MCLRTFFIVGVPPSGGPIGVPAVESDLSPSDRQYARSIHDHNAFVLSQLAKQS